MTAAVESLADAYDRRDDATVELDADMAFRAWTVLDLVCDGEAFATYGPDYDARDALAEALHEAGELPEDRL